MLSEWLSISFYLIKSQIPERNKGFRIQSLYQYNYCCPWSSSSFSI